MKQFKKLNRRPLKIYDDIKKDCNYFNFKKSRFELNEFFRIDRPWFSKEYINEFPDYIHGVWCDGLYYVELIDGYDPKINIYVELK